MNVVVTGANRGIGLGLVHALLIQGHRVQATARTPNTATELQGLATTHPDQLHLHPLDVLDDSSCQRLGATLADQAVDMLINNAGVGGAGEALAALDLVRALEVYDTNALGPLRVTRALLPMLERARGRVFNISSMMGSIADNASGGYYAYRMSKAALNMATSCLAEGLRPRGVAVFSIHPGWVQTDMGGAQAPTSVEESVHKMLELFARLGQEQSGQFHSYEGHSLHW